MKMNSGIVGRPRIHSIRVEGVHVGTQVDPVGKYADFVATCIEPNGEESSLGGHCRFAPEFPIESLKDVEIEESTISEWERNSGCECNRTEFVCEILKQQVE